MSKKIIPQCLSQKDCDLWIWKDVCITNDITHNPKGFIITNAIIEQIGLLKHPYQKQQQNHVLSQYKFNVNNIPNRKVGLLWEPIRNTLYLCCNDELGIDSLIIPMINKRFCVAIIAKTKQTETPCLEWISNDKIQLFLQKNVTKHHPPITKSYIRDTKLLHRPDCTLYQPPLKKLKLKQKSVSISISNSSFYPESENESDYNADYSDNIDLSVDYQRYQINRPRLTTAIESDDDSDEDDDIKPTLTFDAKGYLNVQSISQLTIDGCQVIKQIGRGTFGAVFECLNKKTNKSYAIKIIRKLKSAKSEVSILNKIKQNSDKTNICIHLVRSRVFCNYPIIVFPLYGRSLRSLLSDNIKRLRSLRHSNVCAMMRQLCSAISHIHSIGIIHTDIKPENIVLVNDTERMDESKYDKYYTNLESYSIKLIDFGSAVTVDDGDGDKNCSNHLIQTRYYRAPEVICESDWSYSVDMWSFGCMIVEMLGKGVLFKTKCDDIHLHQIQQCIGNANMAFVNRIGKQRWKRFEFDANDCEWKVKLPQSIDNMQNLKFYLDIFKPKWLDLAKRLLCWNPNDRLSAKDALEHPALTVK